MTRADRLLRKIGREGTRHEKMRREPENVGGCRGYRDFSIRYDVMSGSGGADDGSLVFHGGWWMDRSLNVYLITLDSQRCLFYSEAPPDQPLAPPAEKGIKGWAERQLWRFKTAVADSEGAPFRATRSVWNWLQSRTHPDETLLTRLRHAEIVTVNHPATMTPRDAETLWKLFLNQGRRRHLPWFIVNLLVSPLTVVLAALPGPNLIGYWFVYRAFHHLMILIGLKRIRTDRIQTMFHDHDDLDFRMTNEPSRIDINRLVEIGCQKRELVEFFQKHGLTESAMKVD